jgi:hypothetical protein
VRRLLLITKDMRNHGKSMQSFDMRTAPGKVQSSKPGEGWVSRDETIK